LAVVARELATSKPKDPMIDSFLELFNNKCLFDFFKQNLKKGTEKTQHKKRYKRRWIL
jgi:hypothetical protein